MSECAECQRLLRINAVLFNACILAEQFVESFSRQLGDWDSTDQKTINAIRAAIALAKGPA